MRDFLAALTQRRHVDADDIQPVVEVFAKFAFGDALLEVCVGGCQHADVDALRPRLAEGHDFMLLQKSQQLGLHVERQIADLVEEEGPARRRPHKPGLVGHRPGKAAAPMAEKLAVGEIAASGGAGVGEEHRGAAVRSNMNGA